ncbi:hypothetical protein FDP41_007642 [Naegleria fowleri]|uniref:Dynein light chain n=1 Tax=Naegleria fowleri TaxID=5763 RepID=A0A6A5C2Z7_NAEFO|nr:uncharacterized protein FDP41_007642 [Naegleria fowleri]KAF0983727.1 hypothetical protein FDP41_007642 [Naegleria fowleri]
MSQPQASSSSGLNSSSSSSNGVVIKTVDMTEEMKEMAISVTQQAMEKYTIEKDIASFIKKQFDEVYGKYWHCIVGKSFGSMVTYESKCFIYFIFSGLTILLFKSG